jgi:hypothetical protein
VGSPERRAALAAAALVIGGLAVLRLGFGSFDLWGGFLAVLAGWIVGVAGVIVWLRLPTSRSGLLLLALAAAWGLANLQRTPVDLIDAVATVLQFAWAVLLALALLALPDAAWPRAVWLAILAAAVASLIPLPTGGVAVSVTLIALLGWVSLVRARRRSPWTWVSVAGVTAAVTVGISTIARATVPGFAAIDTRPAIEISLIATGLLLVIAVQRVTQRDVRVSDLVVDVGPETGGEVATRIAAALGDPTLEIAFADPGGDGFVDAAGRPLVLPIDDRDRTITRIVRDGRPLAALVHARGRDPDPSVLAAIGRAIELASVNARLQADVQHQLADVEASRRRLLDAADEERRALRIRLEAELDPRLDELQTMLKAPRAGADGASMHPVLARIAEARVDVATIADGLYPRLVEQLGLVGAVRELARRSSLPAVVVVDMPVEADRATNAALYFVCSEALSNAAKHASASTITIRLERAGASVRIVIEDDGTGGADADHGTGLAGLRDRVEAVAGTFTVGDGTDGGTRVAATIPLGRDSGPVSRS